MILLNVNHCKMHGEERPKIWQAGWVNGKSSYLESSCARLGSEEVTISMVYPTRRQNTFSV